MSRIKFSAQVIRRGRFLYLDLPEGATEKLGSAGRVPVEGLINGYPFDSSVFPNGEGGHYLMLSKEMQQGASLETGDVAKLVLTIDPGIGKLEAPADLLKALSSDKRAKSAFDGLSHAHKKEYLEWIAEAKRPETRARRIDRTVALLADAGLDE